MPIIGIKSYLFHGLNISIIHLSKDTDGRILIWQTRISCRKNLENSVLSDIISDDIEIKNTEVPAGGRDFGQCTVPPLHCTQSLGLVSSIAQRTNRFHAIG